MFKTEKNIKVIISGSNDLLEIKKAFDEAILNLPNISGTVNEFGFMPQKINGVTVQILTDNDHIVIDPYFHG